MSSQGQPLAHVSAHNHADLAYSPCLPAVVSRYHMCRTLSENKTLASINLGKHRISDFGAQLLAEHLEENRTLFALAVPWYVVTQWVGFPGCCCFGVFDVTTLTPSLLTLFVGPFRLAATASLVSVGVRWQRFWLVTASLSPSTWTTTALVTRVPLPWQRHCVPTRTCARTSRHRLRGKRTCRVSDNATAIVLGLSCYRPALVGTDGNLAPSSSSAG